MLRSLATVFIFDILSIYESLPILKTLLHLSFVLLFFIVLCLLIKKLTVFYREDKVPFRIIDSKIKKIEKEIKFSKERIAFFNTKFDEINQLCQQQNLEEEVKKEIEASLNVWLQKQQALEKAINLHRKRMKKLEEQRYGITLLNSIQKEVKKEPKTWKDKVWFLKREDDDKLNRVISKVDHNINQSLPYFANRIIDKMDSKTKKKALLALTDKIEEIEKDEFLKRFFSGK